MYVVANSFLCKRTSSSVAPEFASDNCFLTRDTLPLMLNENPSINLRDNEEFKAIIKRNQNEKAAIRAQIRKMEERGELDL